MLTGGNWLVQCFLAYVSIIGLRSFCCPRLFLSKLIQFVEPFCGLVLMVLDLDMLVRMLFANQRAMVGLGLRTYLCGMLQW